MDHKGRTLFGHGVLGGGRFEWPSRGEKPLSLPASSLTLHSPGGGSGGRRPRSRLHPPGHLSPKPHVQSGLQRPQADRLRLERTSHSAVYGAGEPQRDAQLHGA